MLDEIMQLIKELHVSRENAEISKNTRFRLVEKVTNNVDCVNDMFYEGTEITSDLAFGMPDFDPSQDSDYKAQEQYVNHLIEKLNTIEYIGGEIKHAAAKLIDDCKLVRNASAILKEREERQTSSEYERQIILQLKKLQKSYNNNK